MIGYAAGTTDRGKWLTVIGSAYRDDLLYQWRADAEARAAELRTKLRDPSRIVVARVETCNHPGVTLTGIAYRILPEPI